MKKWFSSPLRICLLYFVIYCGICISPLKVAAQDPPEKAPIKFLALGDSYTIGESVAEKDRWPNQLAARLNEAGIQVEAPKIIARTGWTTDELMSAMDKESFEDEYDLVSLLIGVNNQYRGYPLEECRDETEELLERALRLAGGDKNKVFMVSIPDYGYTPFGEKDKERIGKEIDAFNAMGKALADEYEISFFDITPVSREDRKNWVAADGLHPSGEQYAGWVEVILEGLKTRQINEREKEE